MCDFDGESPSFYRSVTRVARKDHQCCACQEVIRPGDSYRYITGIWDGDFGDYKQCARCSLMWDAICAAVPPGESVLLTLDCGTPWGEAIDAPAPEHLAFLTTEEAQALSAEARI
jgi:hypothetical protein